METVTLKKKPLQPVPMDELWPQLGAIMPKNSSTLKCSIPSAASCSKQSIIKPMTMAEIKSQLTALRGLKKQQQQPTATSTVKKRWNWSAKVDKKSEQMRKSNLVRKVLNFQPDKPPLGSTTKSLNPNNKPGCRANKSVYLEAKSSVRISGVCKIPETPLEMNPVKEKITLANKENIPNKNHRKTMITAQSVTHKKQAPTIFSKPVSNLNQKHIIIPQAVSQKKLVNKMAVPDTPEFNHSWKSSCDSSFLQTEKEIQDMEEKSKPLSEEQALERIVEVSPPLSNPFMDYRNVKENFNDTSNIDTSDAIHDDTIMCFEMQPNNNEADSVIISLCDHMNNAAIVNPNTPEKNTDLNKLLEERKKMLNNIEVLENSIKLLTDIKTSQLKLLTKTQKSIEQLEIKNNENRTDIEMVNSTPKRDKVRESEPRLILNRSPVNKSPTYKIPKKNSCLRKTVFHKSPVNKSPTYKIPNKNTCLRKTVFHKSMSSNSNVSGASPQSANGNKALNMYMEMKEQMTFLNTPIVKNRKHKVMDAADTPTVTSRNLQHQLDNLFNEN